MSAHAFKVSLFSLLIEKQKIINPWKLNGEVVRRQVAMVAKFLEMNKLF